MKIKAIIMKDGTNYTVGIVPADLEDLVIPEDEMLVPMVEEIGFCGPGNLYNKGRQNSVPAYKVSIASSDVRRLVPESKVKEVQVDIESHKKKRDDDKVIPDLPENAQAA